MVRVFVYVHRIVICLSVRFVCLVIQIKTNIQKINYLLIYLTCDGNPTFFKYFCYTFAFTISLRLRWMDGWMDWMDGWMDGLDVWMDEWMDATDAWMDATDGSINEWMDICMYVCMYFQMIEYWNRSFSVFLLVYH